ncbi:MAG: hypothetical protein HYY68_02110 [Thaumarchaeota archaeon]|nr:hypothetical protein [Nitrososphaerota archaeon]
MSSVGLNLVGFYIPLYLSLLIIVVLAGYRRFRVSRGGFARYLIAFVTITIVSVVLFLVAPDPKRLSIPQEWSLSLMVGSGVLYSIFFVKRRLISIGLLEAYAMGTFAMIANDAIRTFLIPLPVGLPIVYWGGSGAIDLIVQFGLFMFATFTTLSGGMAIWRRNLVEKLVGAKWAGLFWSELRRWGLQKPVV